MLSSLEGLRIIYGIWMFLYLTAQGTSLVRFWRSRSLHPISGRHPQLVVIMILAYVAFTMVFQIPVIFEIDDTPCTAWVYFMTFFALIAVNIVMLRIFMLYVAFIAQQKSLKFNDRVSKGEEPFSPKNGKTSTNLATMIEGYFDSLEVKLFLKKRWFLDSNGPFLTTCAVILIEMLPMTGYAIRYPELAYVPTISSQCRERFINRASTLFVALLVVYLTILLVCGWRMKKLAENFFIVREFKGIAIGVALGILVVLIGRIPAVNDVIYYTYPIGLLLLTGIPAMVFWWACTESIVRLTTVDNADDRRRAFTSMRSSSTNMLTLDKGTLKKKSFLGKDNPDFNLYTFLQDEEGLSMFREFLMKEFAVENLLFWMDCNELLNLDDNAPDIPLRVMRLFKKYVSTDAPLMVNISSKCRVQITHRIKMIEGQFGIPSGKVATRVSIDTAAAHIADVNPARSSSVDETKALRASTATNDETPQTSVPVNPKPEEAAVVEVGAGAADEVKKSEEEAKKPTEEKAAVDAQAGVEVKPEKKEGFEAKAVFAESCDEIFHLMATDPFKRFCHTPEFEQWMKKHPNVLPETLLL